MTLLICFEYFFQTLIGRQLLPCGGEGLKTKCPVIVQLRHTDNDEERVEIAPDEKNPEKKEYPNPPDYNQVICTRIIFPDAIIPSFFRLANLTEHFATLEPQNTDSVELYTT